MIDDSAWDLHLPDGDVLAAAVVLHPHPGMGGDRQHPVVAATAGALAERGVAALRVDLVLPDPAEAVPGLLDAAAMARERASTDRLVLVGYSWGSIVTALASPGEPLAARVLIAPPVTMAALDGSPASRDGVPTLVLVPAHDQYGPPAAVREAVRDWPHVTLEEIGGADHFLTGHAAEVGCRAATWVAEVLRPEA